MQTLTIENMEEIEGGSEAGYAVGRAIGATITWISQGLDAYNALFRSGYLI